MSETSIEPQNVAADKELTTYRVLRRDEGAMQGVPRWIERTQFSSKYIPTAADIGEAYGEGDYLLIEENSKYSFMSTYEMRVVADRVYRLADEDA